jgi:hypothetical protein
MDWPTNRVSLQVQTLSRQFQLFHSLQRHHYNFLGHDGGRPEAQNSLMHHNLPNNDAVQDAVVIGRALQARMRQDPSFGFTDPKSFVANGRTYLVDSPQHFFVTSGPLVWPAIDRAGWIAARALRHLERSAITPEQIRLMVLGETRRRLAAYGVPFLPRENVVNEATWTFAEANADLGLWIVSGRADLVRAVHDLNRQDGRI